MNCLKIAAGGSFALLPSSVGCGKVGHHRARIHANPKQPHFQNSPVDSTYSSPSLLIHSGFHNCAILGSSDTYGRSHHPGASFAISPWPLPRA
ncbi:hypothetical protein PC129_g12439 [Phytophthora cactorum]|uniref:Uncharacterized protein n=1 Tax=Phytophthora cactorum TaxID=29920 RepID=A0A8T1FLN2_9STRA|nr:hypothetical protein PC112_g14177 [Phytophthora cactorum]KAG2816324.1 hypothetical protein PC111_g13191 [Phytophthora cactorum]KAG2853059.1 hypothetical protein PC113_g14494 [Phytophthora cactorum]KAG2895716.1 hypothetical protein PC114_g15392 [Phytophthora cactorum]KAG2908308.1 hypothetical protein PC115_g13620 [Phytophthora cactorum]